jgi:hypothetical protein
MNLLTQNSDLKKTGILGWTIPSLEVKINGKPYEQNGTSKKGNA